MLFDVASDLIRRGSDRYRVRILAGAFDRSIRRDKIACVWDHDESRPIGKPVILTTDERGVMIRVEGLKLPRTFSGWSFKMGRSVSHRIGDTYTVLTADLLHVAILTAPMRPRFPETRGTVREYPRCPY